jgi:hypothetical protein
MTYFFSVSGHINVKTTDNAFHGPLAGFIKTTIPSQFTPKFMLRVWKIEHTIKAQDGTPVQLSQNV